MSSPSARYVLVFNGEIYNHLEIRAALAPDRPWRGVSDTETLLEGFEKWGVRRTLEQVHGMFAFALWDREARRLTLARDRLGEKPLYYGWQAGVLLFGSELRTLKAHPAFAAAIDRTALRLLMRHNYIPAPYSIYSGIFKVLPGTFMEMTAETGPGRATTEAYWSADCVARGARSRPLVVGETDAMGAFPISRSRAHTHWRHGHPLQTVPSAGLIERP